MTTAESKIHNILYLRDVSHNYRILYFMVVPDCIRWREVTSQFPVTRPHLIIALHKIFHYLIKFHYSSEITEIKPRWLLNNFPESDIPLTKRAKNQLGVWGHCKPSPVGSGAKPRKIFNYRQFRALKHTF